MRGFTRISAVVLCSMLAGGYSCWGQASVPSAATSQPALPAFSITGGTVENAPPPDSPANRAAKDKLAKNLSEITSNAQGLEKCLNFLRDNMGDNIFVNWTALAAAGVDRNTPVTVSLKNVSFAKTLDAILAQAGGGSLSYAVDDGIITVSTKDDLTSARYQLVKVFDIRNLILLIAANTPGDITPNPGTTTAATTSSENAPGPLGPTTIADAVRKKIVDRIMAAVRKTVAPDTWRDAGGTIGTIRELNGQLIVNQTVENQIAVHQALNQMLDAFYAHVTLETRLVLVPANFFQNARIGWTDQSTPLTPAAGVNALPNASVRAALIDADRLAVLLAASQVPGNTAINAPRASIAERDPATLACTLPIPYITHHAPDPKTPDTGTNPIASADTGIALVFQAAVNADGTGIIANLEITRKLLANFQRITDGPGAGNIEQATIDAAGGAFRIALPATGILVIDLGKVPGDFLRLPDAQTPPERQAILLLRTTLVPRAKESPLGLVPANPKLIPHPLEDDLFGVGYDRPARISTLMPASK